VLDVAVLRVVEVGREFDGLPQLPRVGVALANGVSHPRVKLDGPVGVANQALELRKL
jgi:hypothetical protein